MTITIELPEGLAEQAAAAGMDPDQVNRYAVAGAAAGAVSAVTTAISFATQQGRGAVTSPDAARKLLPEYDGLIAPLEDTAGDDADADPTLLDDLAAAVEEMEADTRAGRLLTLEQVGDEAEAFFADRRAERRLRQERERGGAQDAGAPSPVRGSAG